MTDFSDQVGPRYSRDRFPFDKMQQVGDFFTTDVPPRSMGSTISVMSTTNPGRRFATFSVAAGSRVFLVDIQDAAAAQESAAA